MLMHRFSFEEQTEEAAKRKDQQFDPKADAEKALYRKDGLGCYVPSAWVEACLRDTAKEFKGKGKSSLKGTRSLLRSVCCFA